MTLKKYFLLIIVMFPLFFTSCGVRKAATAVTADILTRGMNEVETEEDTYVANETALPLLKIAEVLHAGNPNNKKFLALLSKIDANYAFGIAEVKAMVFKSYTPMPLSQNSSRANAEMKVETEKISKNWNDRAERFYKKGMQYGIAALSKGKENIGEITFDKFQKRLKSFKAKDAETLFWTAFNWGNYINLHKDDISIAADLPRVQSLVDRVIDVDHDFMCGSGLAFKGALLAANPFLTGSKPEVAKPYFEQAMQMCEGKFLMTKVMYAERYLNIIGDKENYKKVLSEVAGDDASALPRYRLSNEMAKERAKKLIQIVN